MPRLVWAYVRGVDRVNRALGRCAMYLIFVLIGILLWSSVSKTFFLPSLWTLEMAQFTMVAYSIPTAWRPYLWPIKLVMCIGIVMMILQASAEFLRDIGRIRGEEI